MTSETVSLRENISPRTEKWIRISAVLAMIIVACSSAILSFDGLKKVALAAQIPEHLAFLFPIAVDTTILMGSLAVLLYELFGVRAVFGWVTVLFGTFLSIVGNVISVMDAGLIAQVLHGIIPVLLCISLESLLRILRFNIKRTRLARTPLPHLRNPEEDPESKSVQESDPTPAATTMVSSTPPVSTSHLPAPIKKESVTAPPVQTAVRPSEPVSAAAPPVIQEEVVEAPEAVIPAPVKPVEPVQIETVTPVVVEEAETPEPILAEVPEVSPEPVPVKTAPKPAKSPSDAVESYRIVLESFPEETPKARKVAEILRVYPDATGADIKAALGDPPELRIDGTMRRAKEWLKKN